MTLAARSFHREPFTAELFGGDPRQRFVRAHRFYRAMPRYDTDLHLDAFLDAVLVGLCVGSPVAMLPGLCARRP